MENRTASLVRRISVRVLVLVGMLLAARRLSSCDRPPTDFEKPRVLPDGDIIPPAVHEPDHSADIERFNDEVFFAERELADPHARRRRRPHADRFLAQSDSRSSFV